MPTRTQNGNVCSDNIFIPSSRFLCSPFNLCTTHGLCPTFSVLLVAQEALFPTAIRVKCRLPTNTRRIHQKFYRPSQRTPNMAAGPPHALIMSTALELISTQPVLKSPNIQTTSLMYAYWTGAKLRVEVMHISTAWIGPTTDHALVSNSANSEDRKSVV